MLAHRGSFTPKFNAAGGDRITTYTYSGTTYAVHVFLNSGKFTVYKGNNNATHTLTCDILIQAGGGSAQQASGGGGAGELAYKAAQAVTMGSKTVTVGGGGIEAPNHTAPNGLKGGNSVFDSFTANGGGGGGCHGGGHPSTGGAGGSAGGHSRDAGSGSATAAVKTASGLGNNGGAAAANSWGSGAGGGGAGAAGTNGSMSNGSGSDQSPPGNGGNGSNNWLASSTAQTTAFCVAAGIGERFAVDGLIYMAAGGGGNTSDNDQDGGGRGGIGGGGFGSNNGNFNSVVAGVKMDKGLANSGGGGGAYSDFAHGVGTGGTGVVVIRYAI